MPNLYYVIAALVTLMAGEAFAFLWFIRGESQDRRKHYKITLTVAPDGSIGTYESKLTEQGKEALVVVPYDNTLFAGIDIRLSDGQATITDLRKEGIKA